jgi:phenylacetic acid degradation operon negative regulatory protein
MRDAGALDAAPKELVNDLLNRLKPRGKSLIATVFGDALQPHGGGAWLGGLIRILGPMGLSERVVRSSVFRLVRDELLSATQTGRRSFYALTPTGKQQFQAAAQRIYAVRDTRWDGAWTQAWLSNGLPEAERDYLRQELSWRGFAPLGPNLLVHAGAILETTEQTINGLGLNGRVSVLISDDSNASSPHAIAQALVKETWPLDSLAKQYQAFMRAFEPVRAAMQNPGDLDPASCFALRILLIHDYRRVVLRDPMLPADLLNSDWPGLRAAALARDLYRLLVWPSQAHITGALEARDGVFGPPAQDFNDRFGGLPCAES